jgi:hypothetical protein
MGRFSRCPPAGTEHAEHQQPSQDERQRRGEDRERNGQSPAGDERDRNGGEHGATCG